MRNLRVGTMVLALVAVLAMSVVTAATASAKTTMPEIVNKSKETPKKTGFTSKSGASEFETKGGHVIKCKEDSDTGKLTGPSSDESTIKFTGCSTTFILTLKCNSEGAKEGEIVLKVTSELVWLNKTEESEPGEDLQLPSTLTIKCTSSETLHVKGSTVCPISGFKVLSTTGTITCEQSKGVQKFTKYFLGEKEVTDLTETEGSGLISFGYEQSALKSTDSLTYEEEVEII
ncbi:MAG: hypothetical protein ACLPUT_04765 [Solirubrobacteraceae bacterium]